MIIEDLISRIEEMVATLARLPAERPAGYKSSMPQIVKSKWESYGLDGDPWGLYNKNEKTRLGPPSSEAIDQATETAHWMLLCRQKDREVILRRASGERWYILEGRFKRRRSTLSEWRKRGLEDIMAELRK